MFTKTLVQEDWFSIFWLTFLITFRLFYQLLISQYFMKTSQITHEFLKLNFRHQITPIKFKKKSIEVQKNYPPPFPSKQIKIKSILNFTLSSNTQPSHILARFNCPLIDYIYSSFTYFALLHVNLNIFHFRSKLSSVFTKCYLILHCIKVSMQFRLRNFI